MDSEESRPGSSASNSSSSSSNSNSNDGASSTRKSRSKTRSKSANSAASSSTSSRDGSAPKSPLNGGDRGNAASSRSQSPDNKSVRSGSPSENRSRSASKESNRSAASSDDGSSSSRRGTTNRNQSISPARKTSSKSSRASSASSVSSEEHFKGGEISDGEMDSDKEVHRNPRNNGSIEDDVNGKLNMSHEDLSDVSDLDSSGSPRRNVVAQKEIALDHEAAADVEKVIFSQKIHRNK